MSISSCVASACCHSRLYILLTFTIKSTRYVDVFSFVSQDLNIFVCFCQVAQEVKRIRQIKIDKPPPASQLTLPTTSSIYSLTNSSSAALVNTPQTPLTPAPPLQLVCPCCKSKFNDRVRTNQNPVYFAFSDDLNRTRLCLSCRKKVTNLL